MVDAGGRRNGARRDDVSVAAMLSRSALLALSLVACSASPSTPPADASMDVAALDAVTDAAPSEVAPSDVPVAAPKDVPADASAGCTGPDVADLIRALRAPRPPGVSAVAAPGMRFEDLRARFDANADAMTILARARASSRRAVPTLAPGDSASYQSVASLALAAALVAWHDRDAAAARMALQVLSVTAVAPSWFATAVEVPIFVGASLVDLAAAADLLSASTLAPAEVDMARASVGRAAAGTEAWLQGGGLIFMAFHRDNHGMRLGAGLAAAAMVAPAEALSDETLAYALAHMGASIERQTGGAQGWAEGSTYFEYAFEVAAPALAAIDRAWIGDANRCVRCERHAYSVCAASSSPIVRPSSDPRVRDLVRWSASLETRAGWLHPIDDSRLMGLPAPLLERLAGARRYARWSVDGYIGSLGGSVNVGPLVALALASPELPSPDRLTTVWPSAGTARLDATTPSGAAIEAFFIAEHGMANASGGHERPDTLSLTVVVDGALMLGASGYRSYDGRAPFARADAHSEVTVEGVLSRDLGAGEGGPEATLTAAGEGVTGSYSREGVTVTRALSFEAGTLVVRDRVELTGDRDVAWHWHLRGALDAARWSWTVGARRCEATQSGVALRSERETAPDHDDYSRLAMHPVMRQSSRLAAGRHELTTRITCTAM